MDPIQENLKGILDPKVGGMELDEIINFHVNLKIRLRLYIKGQQDASLRSQTIAHDEMCVIGVWIAQEEKNFKSSPFFEQLKIAHRAVHKYAAEIAQKVEQGDPEGALALLEDINGGFVQNSQKMIGAVLSLQKERVT